ncbi:MAG TPA: efflux RND transporter periplasmic adaptor subunit [Spirochaetia bacterium]|nr:efflux RND transporter periplasmic adaptor subunit [Spirochaetia bacterium]
MKQIQITAQARSGRAWFPFSRFPLARLTPALPAFALLALACLSLAACSKASSEIEASGTIEATSVQVSSKSSGEILHLDADEGLLVKQGDILAVIDHASLDIQLGQARSGVDLAKAQLDLLTNGARGEDLAQAKEALNEATETLQNAQEDFQRTQSLFTVGAATKKQRDDAESRYTIAKAQSIAADQALKKLENYARPEDVRAALARVDQAVYSVRLLQKSIQDCTVHSPTSGEVTEKLVEEGELASPGTGLFVISELDTVKLTIYVPEADLGNIRLGQEARISIDSRPGITYPGKVTYISPVAEFTPRDIQTKDERVKLVFAVRIEISNTDGIFKPGMPADAALKRMRG